MRYRLFNLVALASLIAGMALVWPIWRSYHVRQEITFTRTMMIYPRRHIMMNRNDWRIELQIARGRIDVRSVTPSLDPRYLASPARREWSVQSYSTRGGAVDDRAARTVAWEAYRNYSIHMIVLLGVAAIAPIAWLARRGVTGTRALMRALRPKHALNAVCLISFVCFTVTATAWWWSHYKSIFVRSAPTSESMLNWQLANGRLYMRNWSSLPGATPQAVERSGWSVERIDVPRGGFMLMYDPTDGFKFAGIRIGRPFRDGVRTARDLVIPLWPACLLSASLPARSAIKFVKGWKRPRPGMCRHCGYDLRATPERCPECGTVARAVLE